MQKVVTILTLLLFLIIRQGYPTHPDRQGSVKHSILLGTNINMGTPGPGWIEDTNNSDPKLIILGLHAYHYQEHSFYCMEIQERFKFPFHYHPNPLLIDRPPPTRGA